MATKDLVVRRTVQLSTEQLKYIADTEFVPPGLRGKVPAILACVATGRELGIGDMAAIRSIHLIDGKPTFSAELMTMLVRREGHSIIGDVGPEAASATGKRIDNGDTMTVRWTLEMAERAGLAGKQNWKKYPSAMLWARAVSQLCRELFADCFAGATYTPEELAGDPQADEAVSQAGLEPASPADDRLFPPVNTETGEILPAGTVELASPSQAKLIVVAANKAGLDDDARHALVERVTGQPSTKAVPKALVNAVLAEIEAVATVESAGFQAPPLRDAD